MKTHKIKCWPEFFMSIVDGSKTFELRKDDRNYQVGDNLILQEYNNNIKQYSGYEAKAMITYKLSDFEGLLPGFCLLGIRVISMYKTNP